jgi:hypothetical protein
MPTMTTMFRAIVMIAAGFVVVKGWQHYGPSTEQMKSLAGAALEKAQAAMDDSESPSGAPANDPRAVPQMSLTPPPAGTVVPSLAPEAPKLVPIDDPGQAAVNPTETASAAAPSVATEAAPVDPVQPLLTRLQDLGGIDAQVSEWGASGEFFRCSCRAKLEDTSALARHFEAVANEPKLAVEEVVAKVAAWRSAEQAMMR